MNDQNQEYSSLEGLPENGEKCLCFGYKTFTFTDETDENPDWHEVIFKYHISYKLHTEFPEDIQSSLLAYYEVLETWKVIVENDRPSHIIGVTKWKRITK